MEVGGRGHDFPAFVSPRAVLHPQCISVLPFLKGVFCTHSVCVTFSQGLVLHTPFVTFS